MDGLFDEDSPAGPVRIHDEKDSVTVAVSALAASLGVRVLRAGGSVFVRHGLISPRVSPFTTFLVDPDRISELAVALEADGWQPISTTLVGQLLPPAIRSYQLDRFDSTLNLHGVIPGFFADPADVFELIWEHREVVHLRGVPIHIVDKPTTVLLAAHNRLGGQHAARQNGAHFDYFLAQFRGVLDASDRDALLARAHAVGGECEVRPLLVELDLEPHSPIEPSSGYIRRRLAVRKPAAGDIWLINGLERAGGRKTKFPGVLAATRSMVRLLGARRRAAR